MDVEATNRDIVAVIVIKTQISNLVGATRFWNNLHHVDQHQKIRKPNNLKEFGSNKPKSLNRIANMFIYLYSYNSCP